MTGRRSERRAIALSALEANVPVIYAAIECDTEELLVQLIELVMSLDPVPRRTAWPAQFVLHLAERQDWLCPRCKRALPKLSASEHHIDHVVPWSLGGLNTETNLQILHADCNLTKGIECTPDAVLAALRDRLHNLRRQG